MSAQPAVQPAPLIKLDLGCGKNKQAGYIGVDSRQFEGVDQVVNLSTRTHTSVCQGPKWGACTCDQPFDKWPWDDNSVSDVHCSHFVEHLSQTERVHFFNELHRVLVKGGKATIITPHWLSERAYGDPTHIMPPVVFMSYFYLNKEWRDVNAPHTDYICDFDPTGWNSVGPPWALRSQDAQMFAQTHYANIAQDLIMTVTAKK